MDFTEKALTIVLQNTTDFDYFDMKNLAMANKSIHDITITNSYIEQSFSNRLYAMILTYLYTLCHTGEKNRNGGVKIVFKGRKKYMYNVQNVLLETYEELLHRQLMATDVEELFTIGLSSRGIAKTYMYFGSKSSYTYDIIENVHKDIRTIKTMLDTYLKDTVEINVYFHDVDSNEFNTFIVKIMELVHANAEQSIHFYIHKQNFIENILICNEK